MSDSAIEAIYLAISNMKIGKVKSRNLPKVTLAVRNGSLPLRILVPSTAGDASFVAIGSLNKVEWAIRDLCLWAPLSGGGIQQYAGPMTKYIKEYIKALKDLRAPTSQSHITGYLMQMGPMPWADSDYWAVDCTITVEEIL